MPKEAKQRKGAGKAYSSYSDIFLRVLYAPRKRGPSREY